MPELRQVAGGVRAFATIVTSARDLATTATTAVVSVGLEPCAEARLGEFSLRAGVVIPLAYLDSGTWHPKPRHFPAAWGARLGVGYHF